MLVITLLIIGACVGLPFGAALGWHYHAQRTGYLKKKLDHAQKLISSQEDRYDELLLAKGGTAVSMPDQPLIPFDLKPEWKLEIHKVQLGPQWQRVVFRARRGRGDQFVVLQSYERRNGDSSGDKHVAKMNLAVKQIQEMNRLERIASQ